MKIKNKSIAGLVVGLFAVALIAPSVNAATVEELQAQIQALLSQIAVLQAQVNSQGGSTPPIIPGRDLITGITGAQSSYLPGGSIDLAITSADQNGRPASNDNGYNVQAYIYRASDVSYSSYLPPSPSYSYNGTYDPASGQWRVQMNAPQDNGSYNLRLTLYCAKDVGQCKTRGDSSFRESTRTLPFSVGPIIRPIDFQVTAPSGGEVYYPGQTAKVAWTNSGSGGPYSLSLFSNGTKVYAIDLKGFSCNAVGTCTYGWTVPEKTWYTGDKSTEQVAISDGSGRTAYSRPFNIANSPSKNFVDLLTTAQYSNGNQSAFITASIKGVPQNKSVSYWTLDLSCSKGVVVEGKGGPTNMCGSHWNIYSSDIYDVTKDYLALTISATNQGGSDNPAVVLALVAYNKVGASLGGDKEGIQLGFTQPGASIRVVSPNGGETWNAGTAYYIRWNMPTDQRYWTNWYLMPQGSTPRKEPGNGSFIDPRVGGYAIGGQSATNPVANASAYVTIPNDIPGGTYKLRAYLSKYVNNSQVPDPSEALAWDESDSNFKIVGMNSSSPLACAPGSGSVATVGFPATFNAFNPLNGSQPTGYVYWSTFEGNPSSGSGNTFRTYFYAPGRKTVTATSNGVSAKCYIDVVAETTPTSTQPVITVLSPSEGDKWTVGNKYRISWRPFAATADVGIYLNGGGHEEGYSRYIGSPTNGASYFDYAVTNSDLPTAQGYSWKVFVCNGKLNGGSNCGFSGQIYVSPMASNPPAPTGAPAISSISSKGYSVSQLAIGQTGYIVGTGFLASNTLTIDGWTATVSSADGKNIVFTVPSLSPGLHVLQLTNASGSSLQEAVVFFAPATASVLDSIQGVLNNLTSLLFGR